jgi:thiol-disulfide isomerase/thioredoxin
VPEPPFVIRIGTLLATARAALARVERQGGGVRDALWLVLAGVLCFRLEDVARALLGITQLSAVMVLQSMLAVFTLELGDAATVVIPAALAVTILAGRGRRDPSIDVELGAACYVPFFALRSVLRVLDINALFGPVPSVVRQLFSGGAALWASVMLVLALRMARRRVVGPAAPSVEPAPASPVPVPRSARVAVTVFAAMLGAGFFVNAGWVVRHVDAVRPLGRGARAPEFSLRRIDGKGNGTTGTLALSQLRGKVVLLDFWATWCAPCVQMLPVLHDLHARWQPKGAEFVGINSDGPGMTAEELRAFLAPRPPAYPMVIDDAGVGERYKVVALPHMVVVGRDGGVRNVFWGVTSKAELDGALESAVASNN